MQLRTLATAVSRMKKHEPISGETYSVRRDKALEIIMRKKEEAER